MDRPGHRFCTVEQIACGFKLDDAVATRLDVLEAFLSPKVAHVFERRFMPGRSAFVRPTSSWIKLPLAMLRQSRRKPG